jgi:hypothetical protein
VEGQVILESTVVDPGPEEEVLSVVTYLNVCVFGVCPVQLRRRILSHQPFYIRARRMDMATSHERPSYAEYNRYFIQWFLLFLFPVW